MAKEHINLVSDDQLRKESIRYQINQGLMVNTVYQSLSTGEQDIVKKVLFEMYSTPVAQPVALSGLEFTIFGLAKLFFKKNSGVELTTSEQAFYDRFFQFIDQHEITLDSNAWYIPYAEEQMLKTKNNRAEYKERKQNILNS